MKNNSKSVYIILLSLFILFWFRFNIITSTIGIINKYQDYTNSEPKFLPGMVRHYFNIFRESEKSLLIGSSVLESYVKLPEYFKPEFNASFRQYYRQGKSYLQFLNEISLIEQNRGNHLIFFLMPGEVSMPDHAFEYSWLIQPISLFEFIDYLKISYKIYKTGDYGHMNALKEFLTKVVFEFSLNRSKADSLFFSVFEHNLREIQLKPKIDFEDYFNSKPPKPRRLSVYNEQLYQFSDSHHVVNQGKHTFDINLEFMELYIKKLLSNYNIAFVEASYPKRCETSQTLRTRQFFIKQMEDLSRRLGSSKFQFLPKEELPKPEDFLFSDCLHLYSNVTTEDKIKFLQTYFEALSKKLNIPNLAI